MAYSHTNLHVHRETDFRVSTIADVAKVVLDVDESLSVYLTHEKAQELIEKLTVGLKEAGYVAASS